MSWLIELREFEKAVAEMIQNIKFRDRSNKFMGKLNKLMKDIKGTKGLIVAADKTTNRYLVPVEQYKGLVKKEVEKTYRKVGLEALEEVRVEQAKLAKGLGIDDRIFGTAKREAFITLKDHKEEFRRKPTVRLINPAKNKIGKVAMKLIG